MLAKRRSLILNSHEIERTPLLVPSFSSKGFPEVANIIEYCSELIDNVMLVGVYDLHYGKITLPFDFASLIILDTGGYEPSKFVELSALGDKSAALAFCVSANQASDHGRARKAVARTRAARRGGVGGRCFA